MASANIHSPGQILKEGYLDKRKHSLLAPKFKREYLVVEQRQQGTVLSRYENGTKTKLKEEIQSTEIESVEVDKQKHGNYLCIRYGTQIMHLRAKNREHRDEWYSAIAGSLGRLVGVAEHQDDHPIRRTNTDKVHNRPPGTRERKQGDVQTTPGTYPTFMKVLKDEITSPPPVAVTEDEDDNDTSKIRSPFCCVRNHVVPFSKEGGIIADENSEYANVHSIISREAWKAEVQCRVQKLGKTAQLYEDMHLLTNMQHSADVPIYEYNLPRAPEGNDERDLPPRRAGKPPVPVPNNLSKDPPHQQPVHFDPNVTSECDSQSSVEDNNEVQTDSKASGVPHPASRPRQPPQVPLRTGEPLRKKTQQLKEEQRQPHGISKTLRKTSLVGDRDKINLMEENDGIWVRGWDQCERQLKGDLKVGDQLIKINKQTLTSASFAMDIVRSTDDSEVTMVLKRIPHGTVCTIRRPSQYDDLGIRLEGNEIISVDPQGLASRHGDLRPQTTGVSGSMCNWAITEINTQPIDLFASADDVMKLLRQAKEEVVLIVQPVDFIQMMRDDLTTDTSSVMKS